jgi:hypothetical protein
MAPPRAPTNPSTRRRGDFESIYLSQISRAGAGHGRALLGAFRCADAASGVFSRRHHGKLVRSFSVTSPTLFRFFPTRLRHFSDPFRPVSDTSPTLLRHFSDPSPTLLRPFSDSFRPVSDPFRPFSDPSPQGEEQTPVMTVVGAKTPSSSATTPPSCRVSWR